MNDKNERVKREGTVAPASSNAAAVPKAGTITIPRKRIRTVTIGVLIAVIFASTGVGFAVGRFTAPASSSFGNFSPTGGNGNFPAGGFNGPPGGGQGGQVQVPAGGGTAP